MRQRYKKIDLYSKRDKKEKGKIFKASVKRERRKCETEKIDVKARSE